MRFLKYSLLLPLLGSPTLAFADEVSLLSGFFRSTEDDPGFKRQELSLGGRYGLAGEEEKRSHWFLEARLASISYSGDNPPDDATDITLGGGHQYFFRNFGKACHSYLSWFAGLEKSSSATQTTKTESTALVYSGSAGFRFDFTKQIFVETEVILFTSALTRTTETTVIASGAETKSKATELYVDTFSGTDSVRFGVGYIF